jgi:uncharacterized membrane protein YphA (DoxX/SURF4 family)
LVSDAPHHSGRFPSVPRLPEGHGRHWRRLGQHGEDRLIRLLFAYVTIFMETVGALCIALGLGTRFFAAAMAIEFAIITVAVQIPRGWPAYEMYLIWGILLFAIALRGGGPYSLDRLIGKEL